MTPRALLIVSLDIAPEKEDAFNDWYNKKHIPEVLSAPGLVSGKRYRATRGKPKYWAVYEAASEEALSQALASPEFKVAADDFQSNWAPFTSNFSLVRSVLIGP